MAATPSGKGIMLSRQKDLPKLPVPPLKETMDKLIISTKPLVTEEQLEKTKKVVEEFCAPGGEGEQLHHYIVERAKKRDSWLSEWWLNGTYLDVRNPLPVYSSPATTLPRQQFDTESDMLKYASKLVAAALEFKELIDREALPPDMAAGAPLDMAMYLKLFSTYRMPRPKRDDIKLYGEDPVPPRHIIVMHNNQIFEVVTYNHRGKPLHERDIYPQLLQVVEESGSLDPPLGILTTERRDAWAEAYARLEIGCCGREEAIEESTEASTTTATSTTISDRKENEDALDVIQRSILVLCLDPKMESEGDWSTLHPLQLLVGGPKGEHAGNRWYDKTLQFVVGPEGGAGIILEHAPVDGTVVVTVLDYIVLYMKKAVKNSWGPPSCPDLKPRKLKLGFSDQTMEDIRKAEEHMTVLAEDVDIINFVFEEFGKDFIKLCRLSPDSFFQMALQLAYFRVHGKTTATYESGSTRRFLLGRTEAIRSASSESDQFCKGFLKQDTNLAEREALLRKAVNAHKEYVTAAINGHGIDRMLLGLQKAAEELGRPTPKLFQDPGVKESKNFRLSSSQVTARGEVGLFFGTKIPCGYGVCYGFQTNRISVGVSCRKTDAETSSAKFKMAVIESLQSMANALLLMQKAKL